MNVLYGVLMAAIGGALAYAAGTRSEFVVFRLLIARSRLLWGDHVYRFYGFVGTILVVVGVLWAFGAIWM